MGYGYESFIAKFNDAPPQLIDLIDALPGIVYCGNADAHWSMTYLSAGCLQLIALRGRSRTYSREEDRKKRTTNVIPL